MKKVHALLIVCLSFVILSAPVFADGERSLTIEGSSSFYQSSVYPINGSNNLLTFYSDGEETRIAVCNADGILASGVLKNKLCTSCDLYSAGTYSVENGEEFIYVFGESPYGVSSHKAFIEKLHVVNDDIVEVWPNRMYFDDLYSIAAVKIENGSIFVIGTDQDLMASWKKIDQDGNVQYTVHSSVMGEVRFDGAAFYSGVAYFAVCLNGGSVGSVFGVDIDTGNILGVISHTRSGYRVTFKSLDIVFKNGTPINLLVSGEEWYTSEEKKNSWIYKADLNLTSVTKVKQLGGEVSICAPDGDGMLVRVGSSTGDCSYHKIDINGNIQKSFGYMDDSYGQIVKTADGSYCGAGRMNDGSGIRAFFMPNSSPVVNAIHDQDVSEGALVSLNGSVTDVDGDALIYLWEQLYGPTVAIILANSANASFTAPSVGTDGASFGFRLTVSDGFLSATSDCVVNVLNNNHTPSADAGEDQNVTEGQNVALNGTGSDSDDDQLTYAWTQTSGPVVSLSGASSANASFTAPSVGMDGANLGFRLTVSDGFLSTTSDCAVVVSNIPDPEPEIKEITLGDITIRYTLPVKSVNISFGEIPTDNDSPSLLASIGLMDIEVETEDPGQTIQITVILPEEVTLDYDWWKEQAGEWINYTEEGKAAFNNLRNQVVLTITDGGEGDSDGADDGWIHHSSGIGKEREENPEPDPDDPDNSASGGGGGCFIASSTDKVSTLRMVWGIFGMFILANLFVRRKRLK